MFEFLKKRTPSNQIERVYERLLPYQEKYQMAGLNVDFRKIAPKSLVESVFELSHDVQTTAHLIRVLQQRQVAEGMLERLDIAQVKSQMGTEAAKRDADEHYASIKAFCDSIIDLVDKEEIVKNQSIGNFLEENLSSLLAAGAKYSMKFS
jgi:hypothetical protein